MLARPSAESHSMTMAVVDRNAEGRPLKPKALPCRYCSKRFRRVEHVQRHERTHTKEKPFACTWARCGKTFGRRDLLVRHEKLVHLNEGSKDGNRARKASLGSGQTISPDGSHANPEGTGLQSRTTPSGYHGQPPPISSTTQPAVFLPPPAPSPANGDSSQSHMSGRDAASCSLDLLSDAATHLASASEVNPMSTMMSDIGASSGRPPPAGKPYSDSGPPPFDNDRKRVSAGPTDVLPPAYTTQPPTTSFDDYHLFLDDFGASSQFLPSVLSLESDQPFGLWPRSSAEMGRGGAMPKISGSVPPSRFPSVQPDLRDMGSDTIVARTHDDATMRVPVWRITPADHSVIKNRLDEFASVLPSDFVFPSRHTLARFLEGYISGFHEHLPFLHLPTLSPAELSPELILAVLAVGAQYRFEKHRGNALWYAARAVAFEQIRRRHSHEVHTLLPTPAAYSPHSTRPSPSSSYRHSFNSVQNDRPMTQDTHREPYSPNTPQSRLETIQALLLLFAVGLWGPKAILHDALSLQSVLALLVREEGLESESSAQITDWDMWIRVEGSTRTKLIAYCFFNLCSVVYNTTPMLLTSEIKLFLPQPSRLWRAETAWQWQEARQAFSSVEMRLQDAFSRILNRNTQDPLPQVSSLGNYVLIHAFIQHIFLLKQTSFAVSSPFGLHRALKTEDVEEVGHGLRLWQIGFEQHRRQRAAESAQPQQLPAGGAGYDNNPPGGPVAFNASALLRLAYIRLYTDLNPSRRLETRDQVLIATEFNNVPLLVRSPRTTRAVVQAIHALAMLVKAGVNYVARTKSLEWSMQLSLCNMECAILLSKWLVTLASIGPSEQPITGEERTLLDHVRRLLDETEFALPIDPSLSGAGSATAVGLLSHAGSSASPSVNESIKLRQLAAAIIRLWTETFKGSHIFEMITIMGLGLEGFALLLEKPGDQTPLSRMHTASSLG